MAGQPFESRTSVITCDTQGIVQEYAADAADLFGWTQDQVIGRMSVAMFHVPKNVPTLVPRLLREAVEKGKFEEELVLMRKDGSTFRAVLTVRPILRDGQHVGYMGMTRPLTPPGPVPVARLWVQSLRAPFLVASLIPGFVGALAAREAGYGIDLGLLGLALVGLVFIHLGTNMANDAWDYRSGNDLQVRHLNPFAGGGRVLFRGVLNLRTHLAVAVTFLLLIPHRPVPRVHRRPPSPMAWPRRRRGGLLLCGAAPPLGPPRHRRDRGRDRLRPGDGPGSVLRPHARLRSARGHSLHLPRSARRRHPVDQRDPGHPG